MSPKEASSNGTRLQSIELIQRGFQGNHQVAQAVPKTKSCSMKTDGGSPLPRVQPAQLIEHVDVGLVPTWSFYPYILLSLVREVTLLSLKSEIGTLTQLHNLL